MFLSRILKQYEKPVLFGIVILIAVTFGITSEMVLVADRSAAQPAVSYFDKTMTAAEWQNYVWRWRVLFQFLSPNDRLTEEILEEQSRQLLITLHEANAAGIHVSNGEVGQFIRAAMEASGRRFTRESYLSAMSQRRMRVEDFEDTVRDLIKIQKFSNAARNSSSVPLSRVYDEYVKQNEETQGQVVVFRAKDLARRIRDISGAEIARHFQAQQARYQIPDRVQIAYAFASNDALLPGVAEPTEEEQKKYYEAHKDQWVIFEAFPEKKDEGKTEEKKDEGKTDEGKTEEKRDESKTDEGKTEEKKDDASKSGDEKKGDDHDGQPDGKEAEPEHHEPKYKPFEEVRPEIVKALKQEAVEKLTIEKIEELERLVDEARLRLDNQDVDLEGLAKKLGLTYDVSPFISRKSMGTLSDTLGYSQKFTQQVFTMEEGEYSIPMSSPKGWFLFRVLRKKASEPARLTDDVRASVVKDLQVQKGKEQAKTKAAAFHEAVRAAIEKDQKEKIPAEVQDAAERAKLAAKVAQEAFARVATEQKLTVEKTDWFKRDGWIPGLKTYNREIAETVAGQKEIGLAFLVPSTFQDSYVVQPLARRPPDSSGFAQQRDFLRTQLTDQQRRQFMRSFHEVLQERAAIKMLNKKAPAPGEGEPGAPEGAPEDTDHSGHDHGDEEGF